MRASAVGAIIVLLATILVAQKSNYSLTITSNSQLVVVPVIVRGKDGKFVPGLGKDEFRVLEDGHARNVSLFSEVHSPAAQAPTPSSRSENTRTAALNKEGEEVPISLILLDEINTPYSEQQMMRDNVVNFWSHNRQMSASTALYVLRKTGIQVVQPLTTDSSLLISQLKTVKSDLDVRGGGVTGELPLPMGAQSNLPTGPDTDYQLEISARAHDRDIAAAARRSESERTLIAFQQIAHSLMRLPGRKQMIWATAGFPLKTDVSAERYPFYLLPQPSNKHMEGYERLAVIWDRTWKLLNDANVAVYPLNLHRIGDPTFTVDFTRPDTTDDYTLEQNAGLVDTMKAVADLTGGSVCFDGTASCLRKTEEDGSSYYLIGYYLPDDDTKPGWRKLQVKVARSGVHVNARAGFFVADTHSERANLRSDLQAAIDSPMDYGDLPFKVGWKVMEADDHGATIKFLLSIPVQYVRLKGSRNFDLTFLGVAHDQLGRTKTFSQAVTGSMPTDAPRSPLGYSNQLQLPLGKFEVRLVVRDNESGQIGTSTLQVTIANHKNAAGAAERR